MGRKKKIYDPQHLTKRQAEVYEYIKAFKKEKQIPPSVREVQIALGFKSTASIFKYLNDLEKMGLIRRNPAHPRSLEVMKKQFSEETKKRIRMLPMLVSADNKDELFSEDNIRKEIPYPESLLPPERVFLFPMEDDAFQSIGIYKGDYLMIRRSDNIMNGDLVLLRREKTTFVRRFRSKEKFIHVETGNGRKVNLKPENNQILGNVIGLIRVKIM